MNGYTLIRTLKSPLQVGMLTSSWQLSPLQSLFKDSDYASKTELLPSINIDSLTVMCLTSVMLDGSHYCT